MKKISVFVIVTLLFLTGCEDRLEGLFVNADGLLTEEDVLEQDFNLRTPFYGIQVSISEHVGMDDELVLDLLDSDIRDFLNCQFFAGDRIGFEHFELPDGTIESPLSELRLYVVRRTFECDTVDRSLCNGAYFFDSDTMVVAEKNAGRCEDFALIKHEAAHRYGLAADHSNQADYSFCSDPINCSIWDLVGF